MPKPTIEIKKDFSLKELNSFKIDVKSSYFCEIFSINQLTELSRHDVFLNTPNKIILGGGSNILFTNDYDGLVIKNSIKGIRNYKQKVDNVYLSVGGGENWHEFVMYCVENGLHGVENLALIPGTVGAAPIQNIGAYGVEIRSCLVAVEAVNLQNGARRLLNKSIMKMGYRDSIFKNIYKDKYMIVAAHFRLNVKPHFNLEYAPLKEKFANKNIDEITIKDVANAVVEIRQSKLPDPNVIGNAGSFFKNPVIDKSKADVLKAQFADIPLYPVDTMTVKVAAGWLIEKCGWKGKRQGDAGVHEKQALVLVNHGNATGSDLLKLAKDIQVSVKEKFDIELTPEVNIL